MNIDRTCYIYALVDPAIKEVRYVGATLRPATRLYQHINLAVSETSRRHSSTTEWIRGLVETGLRPGLFILEEVVTYRNDPRRDLECEWIWFFRDNGAPLLNRYPSIRRCYHKGKSQILKSCEYSYIKVLTTEE